MEVDVLLLPPTPLLNLLLHYQQQPVQPMQRAAEVMVLQTLLHREEPRRIPTHGPMVEQQQAFQVFLQIRILL